MIWVVDAKGEPNKEGWEICVTLAANQHGLRSYGWYGVDKHLISHDGTYRSPCPTVIWNKLILVARMICDRLNNGGTI